jgi:hypothetical protein
MLRTLPAKVAAATLGLVLTGTAVAAAVSAPPDAADKGLTTAEERTGFPVPVGHDAEPPEDDLVTDEVPEAEVPDDEAETEGQPDNHGAAVSAVAKDDSLTGRDHGQAVSEVARSDAGKPDHGDDGEDEAGAGDDDEDAGDDGEADQRGSGNGKGHGKP